MPDPHWKNWPIALKLTLAMTLMIVTVIGSVTYFYIRHEQETFRSELKQQAILVLDTLEVVISDPLYFYNADMLSDIIEALGREREILTAGRIYDREGRIAADAYDESLAYNLEIDPTGHLLIHRGGTIFEWQADQLFAGRPIVVGAETIGAISIGISTVSLRLKVADTRNQGIRLALTAILIGILLSILVSRSITVPLSDLVTATKHIAEGDWDYKISLNRSDELAILGNAMDGMRSELKHFYQRLEHLVAERTQALQESESRFREVISSINDHIYIGELSEDGKWLTRYHSPNVEDLTGYPLERFMEDSYFWPSLIYEDDRPAVEAQLARFFKQKNSEVEYRIRRKNGTLIWLRDNGRVEADMAGGNPLVYGVVSDISLRKKAEKRQKRLQESLRQAQKMEAIGKLAGGAAHEFNNILAIMMGAIELVILQLPGAAPERAKLEQAYSTGERGRDLVKEILVFSRSAQQQLQPIPLAPVLQNAIKMVESILPSAIELRSHLEPIEQPVLTNPLQLEQVIVNLCQNAIQAMPDGQGLIEIRLDEKEPAMFLEKEANSSDRKFVRLTIEDNGSGMAADVKEQMFDPFFTTKEVGQGTGLGLSVVHGIIQQHGGHISVESEAGKGTVFEIFLPANLTETPSTSPSEQTVDVARKAPSNERILLIDRDRKGLRLPIMALEKLGYQVTVMTDSHEALEIFRHHQKQFNLIVTSLTMPEMPGIQFCRELRDINPNVPLLVSKESHELIENKDFEQIGAVKFIQKPLAIRQFVQQVREVLSTSQS